MTLHEMPERIQLQRVKGWRLPAGAVSVARPGRYGNPFALAKPVNQGSPLRPYLEQAVRNLTGVSVDRVAELFPLTAAVAVEAYELWLRDDQERLAAVRALKGRDLACWCKPRSPCHADVQLVVANELEAQDA